MNNVFSEKAWEDYLYWQMNDKATMRKINDLLKDIKDNGVRIEVTSGNGFTTSKINESIMIVQKTTPLMLKILKDLGLEKPIIDDASDDEYL